MEVRCAGGTGQGVDGCAAGIVPGGGGPGDDLPGKVPRRIVVKPNLYTSSML